MGIYDTYWSKDGMYSVQLKVGPNLSLHNFDIGDKVDIEDGVYVSFEGVVVIVNNKLAAVFGHLHDKIGTPLKLNYETWNSEYFKILFGGSK